MTTLRRRLRVWVTVWLVVQAGSVSALLARDCCAAHQPSAAEANASCHETPAAAHCPMRAAAGEPCPMHRGDAGSGTHHRSSTNECTLRGTCDGPMAALYSLLSNHAILPESASDIPNVGFSPISTAIHENVASRLESPDPPPPRA